MPPSQKTELNDISAMMDAIIEYRDIIAEFVAFDQQALQAVMYRAEWKMPERLIRQITDRAAFLRKAREHAPR